MKTKNIIWLIMFLLVSSFAYARYTYYDDFTLNNNYFCGGSPTSNCLGTINSTQYNATWIVNGSLSGSCSGGCGIGSSIVGQYIKNNEYVFSASSGSIIDGVCEWSNVNYAKMQVNQSIINFSFFSPINININNISLIATKVGTEPVSIYSTAIISFFGNDIYTYSVNAPYNNVVENNLNITITQINSSYWSVSFSNTSSNATRLYNFTTIDETKGFYFYINGQSGCNSANPTYGSSNSLFNLKNVIYNDETILIQVKNNDNTPINIFSVLAYNSTYSNNISTTNGNIRFSNLTGVMNFNISIPNYYTDKIAFSENTSSNYTLIRSVTDYILNIDVFDYNTTKLNLFNVTLNYTQTQQITNGRATYGTRNGIYNIFFNTTNYAYKEINLTMSSNQNINVTLYQSNSILINFYDEKTKSKINNVTIDIIGTIGNNSANYTTTIGGLNISFLLPDFYTIRYSSMPQYPERFYYVTLVNKQTYPIDLYLLLNTSSNYITYTIYDENANVLPGAIIKALRYDITTNSFFVVSEVLTDVNGQARFNLEAFSEFYKFIIEYNGKQYYESPYAQITTNTYTTQIIISGFVGEKIFNSLQTNINLSIINQNTFYFSFNDAKNKITMGCLFVYRNNLELINNTCISGNAGSMYISVPITNGTSYKADAFIYEGDVWNFKGSQILRYGATLEDSVGSDALFWLVIVTIVVLLIFALNAVLGMVLLPIPLIIFQIFKLINFDTVVIIGLTAGCWIVAYIIEAKQ